MNPLLENHLIQPMIYTLIHYYNNEVYDAIKSLKIGKASGKDLIYAEHFFYADMYLVEMLCNLFKSCILHGFLPTKLMQ